MLSKFKTFAILVIFVSFATVAHSEPVGSLFVKAYIQKDAQKATACMLPPENFLKKVLQFEAKTENTPVKEVEEKFKKALIVRQEIFKDCLFKYEPLVSYKELFQTPQGQYTKEFYIYGMNPNERLHFQDDFTCKNRLFEMRTPNGKTRYLLLEECSTVKNPKTWVERIAIFTPEMGNMELLSCAMEKMKKFMSQIQGK